MFEKCIICDRLGQDCMPNLMQLAFADLLKWIDKRQHHLGWTNQKLADESTIPLVTFNRIKSGDYDDCRYYTIRRILVALIGGIADEFPCKEKMEQNLQRIEALEQQAALAVAIEKENIELKEQLLQIEAKHNQEISAIREEDQRKIDFLRIENERKAKIIDKFLEWQSTQKHKYGGIKGEKRNVL